MLQERRKIGLTRAKEATTKGFELSQFLFDRLSAGSGSVCAKFGFLREKAERVRGRAATGQELEECDRANARRSRQLQPVKFFRMRQSPRCGCYFDLLPNFGSVPFIRRWIFWRWVQKTRKLSRIRIMTANSVSPNRNAPIGTQVAAVSAASEEIRVK